MCNENNQKLLLLWLEMSAISYTNIHAVNAVGVDGWMVMNDGGGCLKEQTHYVLPHKIRF